MFHEMNMDEVMVVYYLLEKLHNDGRLDGCPEIVWEKNIPLYIRIRHRYISTVAQLCSYMAAKLPMV